LHAVYLSLPIHSEYVILTDFPPQHWSHERASMLRYVYIACVVKINFVVLCLLMSCRCRHKSGISHRLQFIHYNEDGGSCCTATLVSICYNLRCRNSEDKMISFNFIFYDFSFVERLSSAHKSISCNNTKITIYLH